MRQRHFRKGKYDNNTMHFNMEVLGYSYSERQNEVIADLTYLDPT